MIRSIINNRYEIVKLLGMGGMGEVYLVKDKLVANIDFALKMIKRDMVEEGDIKNFKKEFDLMTYLKHPNLARVYDFGLDKKSGNYFITMEYISGISLRDLIAKGKLSENLFWKIAISLLRTLEFIHSRNIYHHDIKPGNVMLNYESEGEVSEFAIKLMDFGLADLGGSEKKQTKGTLPYMAPEVLTGHSGKSADIYSFGIICLELLLS